MLFSVSIYPSPWYDIHSCLGVKNQLSIYLSIYPTSHLASEILNRIGRFKTNCLMLLHCVLFALSISPTSHLASEFLNRIGRFKSNCLMLLHCQSVCCLRHALSIQSNFSPCRSCACTEGWLVCRGFPDSRYTWTLPPVVAQISATEKKNNKNVF